MTTAKAKAGTKIGDINGPWAKLFKTMLAFNAIMIPPVLAFASWTGMTLMGLQYDVKGIRRDNFTVGMYVEAQDELEKKNPTIDWLNAQEIRTIQNHNIP